MLRSLALNAIRASCVLVFSSIAGNVLAQNRIDADTWKHAEDRIRAIYDRNEFRAKNFRPVWLSDSSGFVIDEQNDAPNPTKRWFYESASGKRREANDQDNDKLAEPKNTNVSPTGKLRLSADRMSLRVVDIQSGDERVLATPASSRDVHYRDLRWSPDGSHVAFVEVDMTDVRQRAVLVPNDPSYPEVQQHRFARVGSVIESLRIGVVNADGSDLHWLPIESPKEGFYLGQVEWAGNSDELLVESFSRFRDRREFWLVERNGKMRPLFVEANETWLNRVRVRTRALSGQRAANHSSSSTRPMDGDTHITAPAMACRSPV